LKKKIEKNSNLIENNSMELKNWIEKTGLVATLLFYTNLFATRTGGFY
jgi:hypothetical protein